MTQVKTFEKVEEAEGREGQIRTFVSGHWVKAGPEELDAVQIFARRLVEDYDYPITDIQTRPSTVSTSAHRTKTSRIRSTSQSFIRHERPKTSYS